MKLPLASTLACLALVGCATTSEPAVRTVTVEIPVHAPCATPPPVEPDWPDTDAELADAPNHVERVRLMVRGRLMRIAYLIELQAHDAACSR